jgi:hypothetical protein
LATVGRMRDKSDPFLEQFVSNALQRLEANLTAALPRTAPQLREFLQGVPTSLEHVFSLRAFPHVILPYWLSPTRERVVDAEFQTDVIYSSISGYYSIRLCDNIADNDCPSELRKLAPCSLYFDSESITPYMKHFPMTHEFWNFFSEFLARQVEASAADSLLDDVDEETFSSLSSKKFTGTKIPISAVRLRYQGSEGSFEQCLQFVDCLGNFAQFHNDFFDWNHDPQYGITTYITSEAKRRAPGESATTWFLREGFDWGVAELKMRFNNVKNFACALENEEILDWSIARGFLLDEDISRARSGLEMVRTFGRITSE